MILSASDLRVAFAGRVVLDGFSVPCIELPELIVDDVFTTGSSIEKERIRSTRRDQIGVVIFARNPTPAWVHPIFTMWGEVR